MSRVSLSWNHQVCNYRFMNETSLNWQDLQLFLSVARAGGLAGAGKNTGKSAATLGRRMLALEQSTGQELFTRHSHGYELTDEGRHLLETTTKLENLVLPFDSSLNGSGSKVIKISAGSWMTQALCNHLPSIIKDDEPIRLRFISSEHRLDIAHRETIIGIRNQRPDDPTLATRKIGRVKFAGYAISEHVVKWVHVSGTTPSSQWLRMQSFARSPVEVTSPTNAMDLAMAGVGRIVLPTFVGDQQKQLMRVTSVIKALSHEQWLVVHQDDRHQADVRSVIDRIYKVAKALHSPLQS